MESCSLFQDLTYSLEIAAHSVGLDHYYLRMYTDAISGSQCYTECFAPEDWPPPHYARAEIEFEVSALDTARSYLTDAEILDTLGMAAYDDEQVASSIELDLDVRFILDLTGMVSLSDDWGDYRHEVTRQERLQAGLENVRSALLRAISHESYTPFVYVEAQTGLTPSGRIVLDKLVGRWPVMIQADLDDDLRQSLLEDYMNGVRAGLEALQAFAQDIQDDFAAGFKESS